MSCFASRIAELSPFLRRLAALCACVALALPAQQPQPNMHRTRARKFIAARPTAQGSAASALLLAKSQQQAMGLRPRISNFTAPWTPLGPTSIVSPTFGNLTGRVTALVADPNDPIGNTLYVGTTGGGVWKSTNAAGPLTTITFAPLTDTLGVFSQSTGSTTTPSLSIGALAVQPASTAVILAGTGDPNDATDSLYGEGLLRSTDGGATWTLITLSSDGANGKHSLLGLSTAALAWSAASPQRVVAAMTTSPEAAAVAARSSASIAGLYYSADAGVTWQMATINDGATTVQSPQSVGTGSSGNAATAVVWDSLRGSFYAAVRGHGYYSSPDGATWTRLTTQPGSSLTTTKCPAITASTCPIFRGALAVQPATGDLYALTVDSSNQDQGLWQDLCSATSGTCSNAAPTWATRLDGGSLETGSGSTVIPQADYNLTLAAAPTPTGTLLLAGTLDLYRCALTPGATSCTWRNTTNAQNGCNAPAAVAPAQHALTTINLATPLVFIGNDGGLWRSTDGIAQTGSACATTDKQHFDNLNAALGTGGSLAEVVGFAQAPTDANVLLAGLGANGSAATATASTLAAWPQLSAGEGGLPGIDPVTPANWYASIGAGVNVKQCTLGTSCAATNFSGAATIGSAQTAYDAALVDAPWLLDPAQPTNLLTATCRIWRGPASTGTTWSTSNALSPALDGSSTPCTASSPLIRSLAAGGPAATSTNAQNSGSRVLYAGLAGVSEGGTTALGGHIFMTAAANTANNTTAWTDVTHGINPDGFSLSSLTVDTHDPTGATVYATVQGFASGTVYRSTDFGAHWTTVSANLPKAPVSALAIDPNDANTVYVASDVGVYATQAISTCATVDCWNLLGTGLPNAPATSLAIGAALPTGDGRTGMLRVGTHGRGIWQTPLLTAVAPTSAAMTLSAATLAFASQSVLTSSLAQVLTVTSSGTAPLTFTTLAITGDFTEADACAGKTLAVGATCTMSVVFAPTLTGTRTGTLTLYANVSGGQATVALTGAAVAAPSLTLTPPSLTFAATTVNQTTAAQTITLANSGGTSATITSVTISGDFTLSANTCSTSLAAQTGCALSVTFTPTAGGTRSGTLTILTSAGTFTASLTGTGNSPATDTLSPLSLTFGTQTINTASANQTITLTNAGDLSLTGLSASTGSSEFTVANACGASLAPHASCAMTVAFAPYAVGTRTATLTVIDQFRSQTVSLTGSGIAPAGVSLTPSSLAFGSIGVGLTSPTQTVTLTNNGGITLTISNFATSGDFVLASSTCGTALAVDDSCTATLVFRPTAAGPRTGAITFTDSAPSATQSVPLIGTGVDFTLTSNGTTTATLSSTSGSATYPLLLSSVSGVNSTAALSCTGAPAHATCAVTPTSVSLGGTITVSVVVATGIAAMHDSRHALPWMLPTVFTACLLPLWGLRRRRLASILALLLLTGCGNGRTIPTTGGTTITNPTPTGTYSLNVTATAAGITHTVPLTLIVQ